MRPYLKSIERQSLSPDSTKYSGGCAPPCKRVMPFDRAGLSLYAPEKDALELVAHDGCFSDSFYRIGMMLDCKEAIMDGYLSTKNQSYGGNLERELEFQVEEHNVTEGIRSYCAVPLIARAESVGVIIILSSQKNRYLRMAC